MKKVLQNNSAFKQIAQKFGLNFLVLFGSQSNGLANAQSDYDFGYSSNENIDFVVEHQIVSNLKNILNHSKIDLINLRDTSPLLAKKALFEGKLLTENIPQSFAKEQIRAYHNYVETKSLRELK